MSVAAEIWNSPLLRIARGRLHRDAEKLSVLTSGDAATGPIASLVRQVFFSGHRLRRTRVLLLSAGLQTNICLFAETVGKVLSDLTGVTVALVETSLDTGGLASPISEASFESWRDHAWQVTDRVWRLPADLLPHFSGTDQLSSSPVSASDNLPFQYVLFAAQIGDNMLPLFCSYSEGAVLVLTANQTRKESAIMAMKILRQCNVEVLGTVLDGRRFPIPDAIYRRL